MLIKAKTNWLAFPVTVKESSPFSRYELLKHLESDGIQTRVLFSGNITRHPIMKKYEYQTYGELSNADTIMRSGFLLGAHHAMTKEQIEIIRDSLTRFMNLKTS